MDNVRQEMVIKQQMLMFKTATEVWLQLYGLQMTPLKQQIYTIFNKKVIILLQQSTFRRFAAKYYYLFDW